MSLAHPALSTISTTKRRRVKFANAQAARQHRELQAEWERKQREWDKLSSPSVKKSKITSISSPVVSGSHCRETYQPSSLGSWITGAVGSKQTQQYTGSEVIGISVLHKSCLQPVFTVDQAKDAAKMRR